MVLSCRDVKALLTSSSTMSSRSSRLRMPEVDAPDTQGEKRREDGHAFGSLQLTIIGQRQIVHQSQRQIVYAGKLGNPASAWAIFAAHASVIAPAKVDQAWEDSGRADAGSAGRSGSTTST
jgi:hypothetical protein